MLEWEAVLRSGFIVGASPRIAKLREIGKPIKALIFRGKVPFHIAIPLGAEPVIFTRHRIQLGNKLGDPPKVRLFLGWRHGAEESLWEFGNGRARHHQRIIGKA